MKPDLRLADYAGRLTIEWGAGFRSWMQRARQKDKLVAEIRDEIEPPFPGFTKFHWNVDELQLCTDLGRKSWRVKESIS